MIKLLFVLALVMFVVSFVWWYFSNADDSLKWASIKFMIKTLFVGFVSIAILASIVLIF